MARILIADDEELERSALRLIMSEMATGTPHEICEARNGHEVLQQVAVKSFDVIFLDIRMPGLDGLATAETLRNSGIETPIVIISAFDTFAYAQKAIRLGVYEYLLKPASAEEVLSALEKSLESARKDTGNPARTLQEAREQLRRQLVDQLQRRIPDSALFAEYEKLASVEKSSRIALAAWLEPNAHLGRITFAILSSAFSAAQHILASQGTAFLASASESVLRILIYGESLTELETCVSNLVPEMKRRIMAEFSANLLIGVAGPGRTESTLLLQRADEALMLAKPSTPLVRLSEPESTESEQLVHLFGQRNPRSLGLRALEYIRTHYNQDISLSSAADALAVNPFHLSHAITRELGIGFSELLARMRTNKAKDLLLAGSSVKEAGYLVGFSDQAYFSKVFKRFQGVSPGQFVSKTAKKYKKE